MSNGKLFSDVSVELIASTSRRSNREYEGNTLHGNIDDFITCHVVIS
jgi:hypothetical protein